MMVRGFIVPHSVPMAILLLAGAALLALAALHDLGFRTVPNRVSAALLAIGLILRVVHHDVPWGLGCGAIVFICTVACWRFGWMGGADVKLLTAAAVFVPPGMVPTLVIGTSLAGGVLALVYIIGSKLAPRPRPVVSPAELTRLGLLHRAARCELRRLRQRGPLPYAAAIAAGGWLAMTGS